MQGLSFQIYSKKLCRVVFTYHKRKKKVRRLNYPCTELENQKELKRLVEIMRGLMVLYDLAEIQVEEL